MERQRKLNTEVLTVCVGFQKKIPALGEKVWVHGRPMNIIQTHCLKFFSFFPFAFSIELPQQDHRLKKKAKLGKEEFN